VTEDNLRYRWKLLRYGNKDDTTTKTPTGPVEIVHVSELSTPVSDVTNPDSVSVAFGTGALIEMEIEWEGMVEIVDGVESVGTESRKNKAGRPLGSTVASQTAKDEPTANA
jgi:hypothetical protein